MVQVYDDNYAEAFALESFYIQEVYNQHKILSMLNEAVCLESGDFTGLQAINESLIDGVKNFFSRMGEFIKKISTKFRERMSELLTTDKAFLEKYKDIILKKPFKDHDLTDVYNYPNGISEKNIKAFSEMDCSFDDSIKRTIDDNYVGQSKEYDEVAFINTMLKKVNITNNNVDISKETEISDYIKGAVQGETTEYKMNKLDPTNLYNFCKNIDATNNQLEKNQKTLNTSSDKIISLANKILTQTETNKTAAEAPPKPEENSQQQDNNQQQNNTQQQNSSEGQQVDQASTVYSLIYGGYINEMDIGKSSKDDKSTASGSTSGSQAGAVTADDSKVAQSMANELDAKKKGAADLDTAKTENDTASKQVDAYQNFFKYCVSVQSNLMTVVMAVYKDYMKILRVHVRDYVGTENDKTAADHQQAQAQTPEANTNQKNKESKKKKNNNTNRHEEDRAHWDNYSDKKKAQLLTKYGEIYVKENNGKYTKVVAKKK